MRGLFFVAAAIFAVGCSKSSSTTPPPAGKVIVALTVDWEGAVLSSEGLDALDALRAAVGDAPVTHFVSAAYFTKAAPEPDAAQTIARSVVAGDEVAMHLHAWKSLAIASKVEPKLNPSFLTGTDQLLQFEDGDVGFDTDLDVYSVPELRAMLRTSRTLLEGAKLTVSRSFRAGGYLATPKVLQAIHDEGYTVDSSATDYKKLVAEKDVFLSNRLKEVWPKIESTTPPYAIPVTGGQVLELPIAAIADYVNAGDIARSLETAAARVAQDKTKNVYVVIAFHQETAEDFGRVVVEALTKARAKPEVASALQFVTVSKAAELAAARP